MIRCPLCNEPLTESKINDKRSTFLCKKCGYRQIGESTEERICPLMKTGCLKEKCQLWDTEYDDEGWCCINIIASQLSC